MAEHQVPLEDWASLLDAMARIEELRPWEWMTELDIFGVKDPESELVGFVSIMGMLGEYTAVAVYLGPEGLGGFLDLAEADSDGPASALFEIPQLQAAFLDREDLSAQDRNLLKSLGLRFRGRGAWPQSRSYRPGYMPWYLEPGEVRFLTHVLGQVPEMAQRLVEDPTLLDPDDEGYSFLVRVPGRSEVGLVWQDRWQRFTMPEMALPEVEVDRRLMAKLRGMPRAEYRLEIDLVALPFGIGPVGTRPQLPYNLMMVAAESGFIVGHEILVVDPTLEGVWARVPGSIASGLLKAGALPQGIDLRSELLYDLAAPMADELGVSLELVDEMPALDEAVDALAEFMSR